MPPKYRKYTHQDAMQKNNNLCKIIKQFNLDCMSVNKHKLDSEGLNKQGKWSERLTGQFGHIWTKMSWN